MLSSKQYLIFFTFFSSPETPVPVDVEGVLLDADLLLEGQPGSLQLTVVGLRSAQLRMKNALTYRMFHNPCPKRGYYFVS